MADTFNLKAIISAVDRATPALKAIGQTAQGTKKYLVDIGNAASGFASKIGMPAGVLSAIAAGFSIAAIKNAVLGFAEAGESIYKGALRAGMGVEEYQRLAFVAKLADVDVESLARGVGKLNLNIGNAASGKNASLAALMRRLQIDMRGANGEIRSGTDLLPELADAFKRNENPAVRAQIGMALFGKAWQEMAPLLMEGSAGITESLERMKKIKGVMDPETIRGAKKFGDELKVAEMVTKGFQMTIAKELVPVLTPLIEQFTDWASANRQVVASQVKEFVKDLVSWVKSVDWAGVVNSIKSVGNALVSAVEFIGGFRNALIALVVFMNIEAIMAFGGLIAALGRMAWQLASLAVTAIPNAVTAMTPMVASLWGGAAAAGAFALKLGAIIAVGMAAYEAVKWIMDVTGAAQWLSDKLSAWTGLDDQAAKALAPTGPGAGGIVQPDRKAQVGGTVEVKFANAPAGMRVEQAEGRGGIGINPSVGYSSDAMGFAY